MMTSAVQYIIILACAASLTSSRVITKCRCLNSGKGVRVPFSDIVSAAEYPPRPYCNRKEVIITLTTGHEVCLDPSEKYTKTVLKKLKERETAKNTNTTKTTTAPETATTTVSLTATTTVSASSMTVSASS